MGERLTVHPTLDLTELGIKVGRLFMAGIPGTHMDPETEALIRDHCVGGVILFSRNIEDPIQLATLCRDLQKTAIRYHGTPLFLAVDQEGGRVSRLREPLPSSQEIVLSERIQDRWKRRQNLPVSPPRR